MNKRTAIIIGVLVGAAALLFTITRVANSNGPVARPEAPSQGGGDTATMSDMEGQLDAEGKSGRARRPGAEARLFLKVQDDIGPSWGRDEVDQSLVSEDQLRWLKKCDAGIRFSQRVEDRWSYPGTFTAENRVYQLPETPPWFDYQLKTRSVPLLLARSPDRHRTEYSIYTLPRQADGFLRYTPCFSMSFPKAYRLLTERATLGGFVFLMNDIPISRVGLIVPTVILPPGALENDWDLRIELRLYNENGGFVREYSDDELKAVGTEALDESKVILMRTAKPPYPPTAKVLWFAIGDDGVLTEIP